MNGGESWQKSPFAFIASKLWWCELTTHSLSRRVLCAFSPARSEFSFSLASKHAHLASTVHSANSTVSCRDLGGLSRES